MSERYDGRPVPREVLLRTVEAFARLGSLRAAARELGLDKNAVAKRLRRAAEQGISTPEQQIATLHGINPEHDLTHPVPAPLVLKGTSTLYDADGKPRMQWVKTRVDQEMVEAAMRAAVEAMAEDIPRAEPVPSPSHVNEKLCNCYVITDFHLGALSWKEETGADWDLKIAERALVRWFEQAIAQSPNAETAVFAQLSDLMHADGIEALTPASKNLLDVDSRFAKVVRTVIRVLRQVIDMMLAKHRRLHIIMADANHDPVSQIWLREWFGVLYENEPRVTVDRSPSPYNAFEFGNVALYFHHGHKRKVSNVAEVFVAQFREMFGRTKYAYAHTGHLHSIDVKENNLMVVEQHRTLAAPDAYAARGGWQSGRDAQCITYHTEYGEVSRVRVSADMLK